MRMHTDATFSSSLDTVAVNITSYTEEACGHMRKPKLAILLPVTLFGVELILLYWGRNTGASVPIDYEAIRVPAAAMVSFGLDPIARSGAVL
jgi:hypothetical protein